ncbi:MAG: hypothetical protein AUG49_00140 [Catenulispora sp. 13_1_20CM_3_70_7]|nr:MAG: hypothetical protein AUG49_00140 [Catenulispora sp. 13_1_20CM_3_70_7]
MTWLAERGTALGDCRQADVDLWRAQHHQHARNALRAFLTWCASGNHIRSIELPKQPINQAQPLGQDQRTRLLGRLLTDEDIPLRTRVAGIIVLLYAQPLTRIVRLTVDDVVCNDDGVLLRLGEPPTPVPAAFAELLQRWISSRDNMNTATNRDSTWLFPGRKAGQPMNPDGLAAIVHQVGVTTAGRAAAIRQHLAETPAPVVADALHYHHKTTTRIASESGSDWSRYAAGDHTRSPTGWTPRRTLDS